MMSDIKKMEFREIIFFPLIVLIFCFAANDILAESDANNVITEDDDVISSNNLNENVSQEAPLIIHHDLGKAINPYFDPNTSEDLSVQAAGVSNQNDEVVTESQADTVIYFTSDTIEVKNSSTNFIFQNLISSDANALVSTGETIEATSIPNLQERQAQVEAIRQAVLRAK